MLLLKNNMGKIRKRIRPAVIRYYLNKKEEYEYVRGLLLLFVPFRSEKKEISEQNVLKIYKNIKDDHERNESLELQLSFYQPYQALLENISEIIDDEDDSEDEDGEINVETEDFEKMEETTSEADIEKFLKDFNQEKIETTGLMDKEELLKLIRSLNTEQRKILDDLVERLMYTDYKSNPIYLYISGDAGKSLAGSALALTELGTAQLFI